MKALFFQCAAAKVSLPAARVALQELEALAATFEAAEASLVDRVRESKARRGEGPPKLRKAKREQLSSLEADRLALDQDLVRQFEALPSAPAIVRALHAAMSADLPTARASLRYVHPDERPLFQDVVDQKARLVAAMGDFLARFATAE